MPELLRNVLLKHLNHDREPATLRLADQQVDMLRHDHVTRHVNSIPLPHALQGLLEDAARFRRGQKWSALVAAEGDEMETARLLKTFESPRHAEQGKAGVEGAL